MLINIRPDLSHPVRRHTRHNRGGVIRNNGSFISPLPNRHFARHAGGATLCEFHPYRYTYIHIHLVFKLAFSSRHLIARHREKRKGLKEKKKGERKEGKRKEEEKEESDKKRDVENVNRNDVTRVIDLPLC